jgi:uncharacterized membrane protein (DUF4010 family)
MKLDPITLISSLAAALCLGALGAFFLYVSPLTIIYGVATLIAILVMFALGLMWGMESGAPLEQERTPDQSEVFTR